MGDRLLFLCKLLSMKHLTLLFLLLSTGLFACVGSKSTETPPVESAKEVVKFEGAENVGDKIHVNLSSDEPFRVGGNEYWLTIGESSFFLSLQDLKPTGYHLAFLLSPEEYNSLRDGDPMYLTYGEYMKGDEKIPNNKSFWDLGTFKKSL